jgi:hypothetical protein
MFLGSSSTSITIIITTTNLCEPPTNQPNTRLIAWLLRDMQLFTSDKLLVYLK